MSNLKPKKIDLSKINSGLQYKNGDGFGAEAVNASIEASAWAQALGTNTPNIKNISNNGLPSVSIETLDDGTPRLVFENLKGTKIIASDFPPNVLSGDIWLSTFEAPYPEGVEFTGGDSYGYHNGDLWRWYAEGDNIHYWAFLMNIRGAKGEVPIVQKTGDSTTEVMSQKAVTDELNEIREEIKDIPSGGSSDILPQVEKNTLKISALEGLIGVGTIQKQTATMTDLRQKTGGEWSDVVADGSFATVDKILGKSVFYEQLVDTSAYSYMSDKYIGNTIYFDNIHKHWSGDVTISIDDVSTEVRVEILTTGAKSTSFTLNNDKKAHTFQVSYEGSQSDEVVSEISFSSVNGELFTIKGISVVKGTVAKSWTPYFEGVKNAKISGIKSIGRNLFNPANLIGDRLNIVSGVIASVASGGYTAFYVPVLPNTDYTVSTNKGEVYCAFAENTTVGSKCGQYFSMASGANRTRNSGNYKYLIVTRWTASMPENFSVMVNFGATALAEEPYTENIMQLPQEVELGEFDYIQDGQVSKSTSQAIYINGSENWVYDSEWNYFYLNLVSYGITKISKTEPYIHKSTPVEFSSSGNWNTLELASQAFPSGMIQGTTAEEKLADFKAYFNQHPFWFVVRQNVATIEPITFENEYMITKGGQEEVITPKDDRGYTSFDYGANTTEDITYFTILGGNE